ncbi:MAG: hypothetical protein AAFP77_13765 [Bacteroidota bacterium]
MKSITRTIITAVLLLMTSYLAIAQVAINTDGASPDSSAMLEKIDALEARLEAFLQNQ